MGEFLMPSLGSDMETGTLLEWEKACGDQVKRGDVIAVIETQKGAIEIEAFEDGILENQLVEIGQQVPVGTPLATIADTVDSLSEQDKSTQESTQESVTRVVTDDAKPAAVRRWISPAARKRIAELGADISDIQGSGPEGAIVLADVKGKSVAPEKQDFSEMRKAIAAAMSHSKQTIPHYYLSHTIDLNTAESWITETNVSREPSERVLLAAITIKAVAMAIARFPEFNGRYENDSFTPGDAVHAGMAINLRGGGLVAPAIRHVERMDIDGVMSMLRDLIRRVREGRFRASELSDPSITISSLGERGVDSLYGVIYPPQVAIIGIGTPAMKPWVDDNGQLSARKLVDITLAADHRVSDGHRGAQFLGAIKHYVETPDLL